MVNCCLCLALAIASLAVTQEAVAQKQPLVFRGKVEQVNATTKRITVNGENVEGWMAAMTMAYPVANAEVLATLKPGDRITAKVYQGDMSLHDVEVVSAPATQHEGHKQALVFRGKVEQVNAVTKRITVNGENVEGWMAAMTMAYPVANAEILATLKPGDLITAKVYPGDMSLHDVEVVSAPGTAAPGGLSLPQLEQMALAGNPTAAQVQANLRAATALAKQAGLYPNPTVGYSSDEVRGGYTGGGRQGGFLSQTIVLGGKLQAARRVAELHATEADTSGQIQRTRIVNSVRIAFYHVLAAQRLMEVRSRMARLSADTSETSRLLANVGQADRPDVLQAEVEQLQAEVSVTVAGQNLAAAWRMLTAVIGKPDMPLARLEGELDDIPQLRYEETLALTLRDSPEVKLAEVGLQRSAASLTQARKVPIPDLQFTGVLANNFEPLESTRRPIGLQGSVQLGVQLPLFNRNQSNIAAAKDGIESSRSNVSRVRLQLQRDMANLFRDYESARAIALQYKNQMLPKAEQAYHLYQVTYRKMAAAYPQVLMSQRTLFQLETEYVAALDAAWQSALAIRGFGLTDGLSAP